MIKRDMFERAATVLKEEIHQQTQLEYYMAEYFNVDSSELQGKYQDSSHIVLMQLLCKLVNDDGMLIDWLYDNYDHQEGLLSSVEMPCGKVLDVTVKSKNDLYNYFLFRMADQEKKCRLCRSIQRKNGITCEEVN